MAHEKTWQFVMNDPFVSTTAAQRAPLMMWWMVQLLLGRLSMTDASGAAVASPSGIWEIAGSSDGVTAGMDGVDRWGAAYDPSKIVFGTTVRSWIVLHNVALGVWITFDLLGPSGNGMVEYLSYVAPTGGSATAIPVGTGAPSGASTNTAYRQIANWTGSGNFHGMLATDGSFFVLASVLNMGYFEAAIYGNKMKNLSDPSDVYPFLLGHECPGVGTNPGYSYRIMRPTDAVNNQLVTSSNGGINAGGGRGVAMMDADGVSWEHGLVIHDVCGCVDSFPTPFVSKRLGDSTRIDGGVRVKDAWIVDSSYREKGVLQDWKMSQQLAEGTVFPSTGQVEFMQVGWMIVPANDVPVL